MQFARFYEGVKLAVHWIRKLKSTVVVTMLVMLIGSANSYATEQPNKDKFEEFKYSKNIKIRVSDFSQAVKLFHWLDLIKLTEIGTETINAIETSGHQLTILHSSSALLSAGVTGAPLSSNLTNGVGEDVYIKFYLDMDDHGTNCVLAMDGKQYIEYTAIQNLFHELSHARHKMKGTWLYFDSEGQAIREENIFRMAWAEYKAKGKVATRIDIKGIEKPVKRGLLNCPVKYVAN
ncbi:MAG: type III secretion system effector protein [Kangiellaceae bacterium]|nr:type III secretion system effector protein [Kangiellaceae bacterium]MCW9015385.1 type III secretion system effector protein [Kangiellaceae bacterium]